MTRTATGMRTFTPGPLRGSITMPGDKSISHRALLAGSLHRRPLTIRGLNPGLDVRATREALLSLGVSVEGDGSAVRVGGRRLREPFAAIDCMNSGSTARMLLGLCAGADVRASFDGDASLRRRPMEPVAAQLRAFGSHIETSDEGTLPLTLSGTPAIETRHFILLQPSAQIKSALLFAAAAARERITISADRRSRDHTERLFRYLGASIDWNGNRIALHSPPTERHEVRVPGDFSSAAFFITAATLAPGSDLTIRGVNVNPTRTGLLDVLSDMGADISVENERVDCGEPVGDLRVRHAPLSATSVSGDAAVRAIDEIPLVAVAAAFATGETRITGVGELRSKESDRLAAIERLLESVSIPVERLPNGIAISGGTPAAHAGACVATRDDHRTAMAAAVLGACAGPVAIDDDASIDVSFPDFIDTLRSVQS